MISYQTDGVEMPAIKKSQTTEWIKAVAATYKKRVGEIAYIFCSDEKILEVNRQYLQHDYYTDIITFDYCEGNRLSGDLFISLDTMRVIPENMRKAAAGGFINATDCADWLTKNGVPFRDAYKATGELVARCIELGTDLENLPMDEYKKVCDVFNDDVYSAISLERCTNERTVFGGPASTNVKAQAKRVAEIAEKL